MNKQSTPIGVDMLYIAEITAETDSTITYGDAIKIPGVTEINLASNNSVEPIYADDGVYEAYNQQGDIEVTMPLIGLDAETYGKVTGASYSATSGVVEDTNSDTGSYFAVGFRAQKVDGSYRFVWLTKGKFSKPDANHATKSDSVTPALEEYMYKVVDRYDQTWRRQLNSDDTNLPSGNTVATLSTTTADTGWFSDPDFVPTTQS